MLVLVISIGLLASQNFGKNKEPNNTSGGNEDKPNLKPPLPDKKIEIKNNVNFVIPFNDIFGDLKNNFNLT